jgi:integrase/recombinase XerD
MSIPVVIGFSSLMILRYIGGEFDDDSGAFRLFGGIFMLFALFARSIFSFGKRKWV